MVVREETQEVSMSLRETLQVRDDRTRGIMPAVARRCLIPWAAALRILLTSLAVFAMLVSPLFAITPAASADETDSSDSKTSNAISLEVKNATTTLNGENDYTAQITITNNRSDSLGRGTLHAQVNPRYTFDSSLLLQEWADTDDTNQQYGNIRMTDDLGSVSVGALDAGQSTTVTIHTSADDSVMKRFTTWGPKALSYKYECGNQSTITLHSFITRTQDGLNIAKTPQIGLVMALPLTTAQWKLNDKQVNTLLTQNADDNTGDANQADITNSADGNSGSLTRLTTAHNENMTSLAHILQQNSSIQTVADPVYLKEFSSKPTADALMQPAGFDVAFHGQNSDAYDWQKAGLSTEQWNASATGKLYQAAMNADGKQTGQTNSTPTAIAWQSRAPWTMQALTEAKKLGYSTVVAESGYDSGTPDAVHTSKITVPTAAGNVNVLNTQKELSSLAQGTATSENAVAESTSAGRLSRFVAQTAFYQMERPYEKRTLLVSLGSTQDANALNSLMRATKSCDWLKLESLNTLIKAQSSTSSSDAVKRANAVKPLNQQDSETLIDNVKSLQSSRTAISQFATSVLADDDAKTASPTTATTDAQSWINTLLNAHDDLALKAFSSSSVQNLLVTKGCRQLANGLYSGISIAQPEAINVVSQSAEMPITISNDHPYPVHIRYSASSDSTQLTTANSIDVVIPAHGKTQSTLNMHVQGSLHATVTISLTDRNDHRFGTQTYATVISFIQINDWSGYAILAFALLLGIWGLWRQFHRVKDPDE